MDAEARWPRDEQRGTPLMMLFNDSAQVRSLRDRRRLVPLLRGVDADTVPRALRSYLSQFGDKS
jgi:hypothetical protein